MTQQGNQSDKIPMISMVTNWIAILAFGWQVFGGLGQLKSQIDLMNYRLQKMEESIAVVLKK
jgi:hypothetical protein